MEYGLIGAKLGHSYSKIIHEAVCGYSYELHPLPTEKEAHAFMQAKAFKAINVTIPYKKLVIPYCDEVEPRAAAIGAVNTVVNRDGKLYGYNTDYTGFAYLARCHGVKFAGAVVLVLGILLSTPLLEWLGEKVSGHRWIRYSFLSVVLVVSIAYLVDATYNPFLYFRF